MRVVTPKGIPLIWEVAKPTKQQRKIPAPLILAEKLN